MLLQAVQKNYQEMKTKSDWRILTVSAVQIDVIGKTMCSTNVGVVLLILGDF